MAKRKEPKEKAPAVERTRATNPIYQGEYTVLDYDREVSEGKRTLEMSAFLDRFRKLPPEEAERLEGIDRRAWEGYDGPRTWDGLIREIRRPYLWGISPLDYYRHVYEAPDDQAIKWRIGHITQMAEYCQYINETWEALESFGLRDEFKELVKTYHSL